MTKLKRDKYGNFPPVTVITSGRLVYDYDPTPEVAERVKHIMTVLDALLIGADYEAVHLLIMELEYKLPMRTKAELKRAIQHDQECLEYLETNPK